MAEATPHSRPPREIRKYPNRRYYDTVRSRHVTLEEIHALIRDGHEVCVKDSASGQDITARVLAQIILELDPPKLGVFPVAMLHQLLRSNGQLVNDFIQKYFSQALTTFLDSQRSVEQHIRQAMGLQQPAQLAADWMKAMAGPFNLGLLSPVAAPPAAAPEVTPAAAPAPEAKELRRQMAELRRQLSELRGQQTKRPAEHRKPGRRSDRARTTPRNTSAK